MTFTLMDWYHEEMPDLLYAYQSREGVAEDGTPLPSAGGLINLGKDVKIHVKPSTTYFIHIICPGNYPGHAWLFEDHPMTTVEVDGVYVEPVLVNVGDRQARIAPGQRLGVLITTKDTTDRNYAIFDTMDSNMLFINKGIPSPPSDYPLNTTAWLVYDDDAPLPPAADVQRLSNDFFFDDLNYIPLDHEPLLEPVDHQIILETARADINGVAR
jgi:iron transport multicopper oxidase